MATTYKQIWGTKTALAATLASLASSSSLLAGRQTAAIDAEALGAEDIAVGVKLVTGGSTPGGPVEVWAFGSADGTNWPTGLGAADAAVTLPSTEFKNSAMKHIWTFTADAVGGQNLELGWATLRSAFGNALPKKVCLFITQASGAALSATGGDHVITFTTLNSSGVTS